MPPEGDQEELALALLLHVRAVLDHLELWLLSHRTDHLEHSGELSDVEDVVELQWRRQDVVLHLLPQRDRGVNKHILHGDHFLGVLFGVEEGLEDLPVDVLDGPLGGGSHVEGEELALQPVRDVIPASSRMVHGTQIHQILNGPEVATVVLGQEVEAFLVDELPGDLQGDLVAPGVHKGHGHVIQEHRHLLPIGRVERPRLLPLHLRFYRLLEVVGGGGAGEVDPLEEHLVLVELGGVHEDNRGFGGARASHEQGGDLADFFPFLGLDLGEAGDLVDDELGPGGVDGGDQQLGEGQPLRGLPLLRLPQLPLLGDGVDVVVVDRLLVDTHLLLGDLGHGGVPGLEVLVEHFSLLVLEEAADGPGEAVDEELLEGLLVQLLALVIVLDEHGREEVEELVDPHDGWRGHHVHVVLDQLREVVRLVYVLVHHLVRPARLLRVTHDLLVGPVLDPLVHQRLPVQIRLRHIHLPASADRRGRSVVEVLHLEDHLGQVDHGDPLRVRQRQDLVVVQHRVQVLYPQRVHRPIANDPRVVAVLLVVVFLPDLGEDPWHPLASDVVHHTVHLLPSDGLRVDPRGLVVVPQVSQSFGECAHDLSFSRADGSYDHVAMSDEGGFIELDDFEEPGASFPIEQVVLLHEGLHGAFHILVDLLGDVLLAREDVSQQLLEQGLILSHQLGQVHVPQGPRHDHFFIGASWLRPFDVSGSSEDREDVPEAEVVVPLLGELLLAELVEDVELLREWVVGGVPHRGQLHLDDRLPIWHHHGDTPEENLEVLGQLLPPSVAGVHGDEVAAGLHQHDRLGLVGEVELLEVLLLGHGDGLDLRCHHRQGRQGNPVELIETAPQPGLTKTLEDLRHVSVLVLVGAVGDHHEDTQRASQVLHRLCLARPGWPCWGTPVEHPHGLRKGDVATICEWRDAETLLGAQELVGVDELHISDVHSDMVLIMFPGDSGVFGPVEVICILDPVGFGLVQDRLE
mmetsp:Transcript_44095/g.42770  ORF Transcript_44095/g.42770 Transcript_44095/m.42770 type:complete len:971 (-) Transcript_44095:205-3117(-)